MMWWLFHARGGKQVAMRDGDYKMLAHMSPQANAGSIADAKPPKGWSKMKFIKEARLDGFTMYDLTKDPSESHDLSAEQPERFAKLQKRMIELHREIQAEGPVIELGRR
jgi:arylsulfatase A-like enzyme